MILLFNWVISGSMFILSGVRLVIDVLLVWASPITHSIKSNVHIFHSTSGKKSFIDDPTCTAASSSKMLPCEELRT